MISVPFAVRIFAYALPTDMRKITVPALGSALAAGKGVMSVAARGNTGAMAETVFLFHIQFC